MAHASASILVRDGWVTALGRPVGPGRERLLIRILLVVVMISSYALAVTYRGSLVDLLLYAYGPVVQFAPAVVATLYLRRATGSGLLAGMIVGIVMNITFAKWADLRPWPLHAGIYGLAANMLVVAVVSAFTQSAPREEEERYLEVARGSNESA